MTSSSASSPAASSSSEGDKNTSVDEDVTPKASPTSPQQTADEQDENDNTLTMPSTSQGYQADSSPAHGRSAPSSHRATSPSAARRVETPLGVVPNQQFYYFTTDMANQAALDIEKEKEKFDSLVTWYRITREDVPALGTSSLGNSAAPSYVSDKGSTTPMSSQPSSHQSGVSGATHSSGHNGFSYSPFGLENPSSNDPLECRSSPVNLDDICPTLEDIMAHTPSSSSAAPANSTPTPLNPIAFNHQTPSTSSNPPSNQGLKRKAPCDADGVDEGSSSMMFNPNMAKQPKMENFGREEQCPMRKLEMMANAQNFMAANTINEVVEPNKKDDRALKMEKLEGIEKSVEEEMHAAHMKRMAAAAAAGQPYPSPGQFPGPQGYPGMPPHPGMHGMPGPPFSAGTFPTGPPGGPYPPYGHPMFPGGMPPGGITPGGYPMSAPGKMPFGSPSFPGAPSPAAMAAMRGIPPPMPPHMMTPQQQHHYMAQMHHMNQMAAAQQKAAAAAAAAAAMSPNMMAKGSPMQSPFPPGHPANQNPAMYHHHMMMMRQMQAQQQAPPYGFPPGVPPMHPGMPPHPGMPMPGMPGMPGMMNPQMQPHHPSALLVAQNRGPMEAPNGMTPPMWQLTPHYPPPFPTAMQPRAPSSGSGAATPNMK